MSSQLHFKQWKLSNIQLSKRHRVQLLSYTALCVQYAEKSMHHMCTCTNTVYCVYVLYVTGSLAKPALKHQVILSFARLSLIFFFIKLQTKLLFKENLHENVSLQEFGWLCRTKWQALECGAACSEMVMWLRPHKLSSLWRNSGTAVRKHDADTYRHVTKLLVAQTRFVFISDSVCVAAELHRLLRVQNWFYRSTWLSHITGNSGLCYFDFFYLISLWRYGSCLALVAFVWILWAVLIIPKLQSVSWGFDSCCTSEAKGTDAGWWQHATESGSDWRFCINLFSNIFFGHSDLSNLLKEFILSSTCLQPVL